MLASGSLERVSQKKEEDCGLCMVDQTVPQLHTAGVSGAQRSGSQGPRVGCGSRQNIRKDLLPGSREQEQTEAWQRKMLPRM